MAVTDRVGTPPPPTTAPTTASTTASTTAPTTAPTAAATASATAPPPAPMDLAKRAAALPTALRDRIPKLEPRRRRPPPTNPVPVPATPELPPPSTPIFAADEESRLERQQPHVFLTPRRRILSPHDHELFLASPTCTLLQAWVFGLADAVVDTPAGVYAAAVKEMRAGRGYSGAEWKSKEVQRAVSPAVRAIVGILDEVEALVYANPPDETGGSRFGNKRFRDFVDAVRQRAGGWHARLGMGEGGMGERGEGERGEEKSSKEKSSEEKSSKEKSREEKSSEEKSSEEKSSKEKSSEKDAVAETAAYLGQAFGNRARIDYGSGHELHFVVWLLCLYQLGVLRAADRPALVLVVFARYLEVMRVVQTTYYLEPAGSHGVWGLDDYQFLPFLWGAAQLLHHRYITPRGVHQPLTLEQFGDDYLYLGQVRFVNSIKVAGGLTDGPAGTGTGSPAPAPEAAPPASSLRWHSPMLDDISAAKSWEKIEAGMRRMFLAEVLRKLPVMQHFLFGSLVPAAAAMTGDHGAPTADDLDSDADDADADTADATGHGAVQVFQEGGVRHIHNPSGWGDCCGIRVPSSLGAAGELRKRGAPLRRIPFD